jgi:hypothetical protein
MVVTSLAPFLFNFISFVEKELCLSYAFICRLWIIFCFGRQDLWCISCMPQLPSSALPPLTVQPLLSSGKQRKIAKYYKKQESLLKDFSDMETMNEFGCLDQSAPSEVIVILHSFISCVICDHGILTRHPILFYCLQS